MEDFSSHPVSGLPRPRFGRVRAIVIGAFMIGLCLTLAGGTSSVTPSSPAFLIAGMSEIPSPPKGSSWAPNPVDANGLKMVASTDGQQFQLHTSGGDRTFLPGVNLGGTTPGHQPGELSISAAQYRAWFAAMSRLGIRAVRIYTIHPPSFYQQFAAYNEANPQRPLYLMQGVYPPDQSYVRKRNLFDPAVTTAFQRELKDASGAVSGHLSRPASPGRASGVWDTDITRWLLGWIIGAELDPYAGGASDKRNASAPGHDGKYFRSTGDATPTERWLAARMDELAGYEAEQGLSQPIAFVNWPTTDPLRHPDEPQAREDMLQLDANHVRPTADWPAGTFAGYHAYPYYPDFQRHEPALQDYEYAGRSDPYAGYVAALGRHHSDMPTLITEFGVPSSIGSAHNAPLGRTEGDHSEQQAMQTDADLLRLIHDQNLAGGFLFEWTDEWFKFTSNTAAHQDADRRPLWHDPMTGEQNFGLLAMDAEGDPGGSPQQLLDTQGGWPARRVAATVDEAYVNLTIGLGGSPPDSLALGFDVLPGLTGTPFAGSSDRKPDAVLALNLVARTGQAYLRNQLDPLPLDYAVPASQRGPAPDGWKPFDLLVNRPLTVPSTRQKLPLELQDAGILKYGTWDPGDPKSDSRSIWHIGGGDLVVRVPWALLGFADPSSHEVAVPKPTSGGRATLTTQTTPGITMSITAAGSAQQLTQLTWVNWTRPNYAERLKEGADRWRDAALDVAP
ncbi:MAG TPA: hypothetical protein VGD29_23705 [Actinoplanes sp.]